LNLPGASSNTAAIDSPGVRFLGFIFYTHLENMSLITINVKVVGGVKPSRPISPFEIAQAVAPYIGKEFNVTIQNNQTPQQLADMVDVLLGVSPGSTFQETLIETSGNVLDNQKSLEENGIADGSSLQYRFYIVI
jgi:hypothetical protein